jgi:hypothetical protein
MYSKCTALTVWLIDNPQFVPSAVWMEEGFTSRKQMKDTMYSRAKVSYLTDSVLGMIREEPLITWTAVYV